MGKQIKFTDLRDQYLNEARNLPVSTGGKGISQMNDLVSDMNSKLERQRIYDEYLAQRKKQQALNDLRAKNQQLYLANTTLIGRAFDSFFGDRGGLDIKAISKDKKGNFIDGDGKIIPIERVNQMIEDEATKHASSDVYNRGDMAFEITRNAADQGLRGVLGLAPSLAEFVISGVGGLVDDTVGNFFRDDKEQAEHDKASRKNSLERLLGVKTLLNKATQGYFDSLNENVQADTNELEQIYAEERKRGKKYSTTTEDILDTVFDKGINKGIDWFNDGLLGDKNEVDTYKELHDAVLTRAMEMEGRSKQKMFDTSDLAPLSDKKVSVRNKVYDPVQQTFVDSDTQFNEEILPNGSQDLLDTQIVARNDDGSVRTDRNGMPVYVNKYSLGEKLKRAQVTDYIFDKYNTAEVADLVGNMAGFYFAGRAGGNVASGATEKALNTAAKASKALNLSTKAAAVIERLPTAVTNTASKVASSRIGQLAGRALSKNTVDTMLTSYLLTNTESQQIGDDAYKNVYNNVIDKAAGINMKEIRDELKSKNPNRSDDEINLMVNQKQHELRNQFEEDPNNSKLVKEAAIAGSQAESFATSTNNTLAFLLNLTSANLFVKKPSFSRTVVTNPFSTKGLVAGLGRLAGEGLQEGIEEGFVNQISQKGGESYGNTGKFKFDDYLENDLFSAESLEQGILGALMGIGQTGMTKSSHVPGNLQRYNEQKKQIRELMDMGALPVDQVKNLVATSFNVDELNKFTKEIQKLTDEGKTEEVKALQNKLLLNQSVRAAVTGTSHIMTDTLNQMLTAEEYSEEDRANIQKAIQFNEMIADMHDKHINFAGRNHILQNRGNKFLLDEVLRDHQNNTLSAAQNTYNEAVDRTVRQNLESGKASMSPSQLEEFTNNYADIFENAKSAFTPSRTSMMEYDELLKTKEGIAEIQNIKDRLDEQYKQMLSPEFQSAYRGEIGKELTKKILNSVTRRNAQEAKQQAQEEQVPQPDQEQNVNNEIDNKAYETESDTPVTNATSTVPESVNESETVPATEEVEEVQLTAEQQANWANVINQMRGNSQESTPRDDAEKVLEEEENSPFNAPLNVDGSEKSNKVIESFRNLFSQGGTFKGTLGAIMNEDPSFADEYYEFLAEGYNQAHPESPISKTEQQRIYNQVFGDTASIRKALADVRGVGVTPSNKVADTIPETPVTPEVVEVVEQSSNTNESVLLDMTTKQPSVTYKGYKTVTPDIKLSFLGQDVEISEDGTSYTNASNDVNPTAFPAIHYDNFKPGDKVSLDFYWDFFRDNSTITTYKQNADGSVDVIPKSIKKFVEDIFGPGYYDTFQNKIQTQDGRAELLSNPEFLGYMPTTTSLSNGQVTGLGINSIEWWNTKNVGLEMNTKGEYLVERQRQLINEARQRNFRVRQALASGTPVELTVESRSEGFHNKLLLETEDEQRQGYSNKFQSILDSFKGNLQAANSTLGLGTIVGDAPASFKRNGKIVVKIGGQEVVLTKDNSNIVEFKNSMNLSSGNYNGKPFMAYQTGYNAQGDPVYTLRAVITNHPEMSDKHKVQFDILQRIKQLGNIANGSTPTDNANEKEKAQKMFDFFKRKYNINIADWKELSNKLQEFYPKKMEIPEDRRIEFNNRKTYKTGDIISTPNGDVMVRNPYKQDYNVTNKDNPTLPDLTRFNSIADFERAVLSDGILPDTTANQIFMQNTHTQYVFSEISDANRGSIWTTEVQPKITFSDEFTQSQKQEDKAKEIEAMQSQLEVNERLQEEIQERLSNTEDRVEKRRLEKERARLEQERQQVENELFSEGLQVTESEVVASEPAPMTNSREFDEGDIDTINQSLMYNALKNIKIKDFTRQDLLNNVIQEYHSLIDSLVEKGMNREVDFLRDNRAQILGEEYYDGSVMEMIDTLFDLNPDEALDFSSEFIKDQNKDTSEVDITASLSLRVKMLLSGIQDSRANTQDSFARLPEYFTFKDTMDFLQQGLSEIHNNSLEDFETWVRNKVSQNPREFIFYNQILKRLKDLKKTDEAFLNEIMYFLHQPKVEMTFMMYSMTDNGTFVIQKYDANAKSPEIAKRNKWRENLKTSPLIELYEDNFYTVNDEAYNEVEKLYKQIVADREAGNEPNFANISRYFNYFGINLNQATLRGLHNNVFNDNNYRIYYVEQGQQGTGILAKNQIFENLFKNIQQAKGNIDLGMRMTLNSNSVAGKNDIFLNPLTSNTTSSLKRLIDADNLLSAINFNTMRIAGKSINPFQQSKSITNTVSKLKNDKAFVERLKNTPITGNSLLLEMMDKNPAFTEYFSVRSMSLEALKRRDTDSRDDMGATDLSDLDAMVSLINLFGQTDGAVFMDEFDNIGLKLRKGSLTFPTLSDSSQQPIINTILLDLQQSNFNDLTMDTLGENVLGLIVDKMVRNELNRVSAFLKSGQSTNVKGHDAGAQLINSITSLNSMLVSTTIKDNGEDVVVRRPLIEVFKKYTDVNGNKWSENVDDFIDNYQNDIHNEIRDHIRHEVSLTLDKFREEGIYLPNEEDGEVEGQINNIDSKYLDSKGTLNNDQKIKLIAYDYIVNNLITLNEIQNLFAGDTANYFKDKLTKNFEFGLPVVTAQDLAQYYYPQLSAQEVDNYVRNFSDPLIRQLLDTRFPKLLSATEIALSSLDDRIEDINPIARIKLVDVYKDVQNNLSKRLKELISPGNQYPNSMSEDQTYLQIMLQDIENSSEVLHSLAQRFHPTEYPKYKNSIDEFKRLDDIYPTNRNSVQSQKHTELMKELSKNLPQIKGFLKTASTDAQEYSTWQDNLNQLRNQGRVTEEEFNKIFDKLQAQSEDIEKLGYITEANKWSKDEKDLRSKSVMQVSKPLYSGHHLETSNGYNYSRYIYIKSSSFALTPELTVGFPKLNNMRKNLERLQVIDPKTRKITTTVRASYDSANKVGAAKQGLPVNELYKDEKDFDNSLVSNNTVQLEKSNFYIQQDKPFKSDKNAKAGKRDKVTRATQFEKILLGDGINKIQDDIFPNFFDPQLLEEFGIESDGMLTGPQLKQLYDGLYQKEQKLLTDKFNQELGITSIDDIANGKPEVLRNLVSKLKARLSNKQDLKSLELEYSVVVDGRKRNWSESKLVEELEKRVSEGGEMPQVTKAQFKIPLYMMPNSNKFESVLNSMINKSNINLELPGFSSPVASQEGFDFKGYTGQGQLANLKKNGLITTKNFDPSKGLQATRNEDGKLKYAQVFIANKFKVYDENTGQYNYIDLKQFVDENGQIDTQKLPEELLSMFSFRIPTSSHQSGVIIEIAGFLPHSSGDLMIVPKDHTVQIGEDYDIDTRYVYQYNYFQDKNGNLKKMSTEDLSIDETEANRLTEAYNSFKQTLIDTYFESNDGQAQLKNPVFSHNREVMLNIASLNSLLDNWNDSTPIKQALSEEWELEDPITKADVMRRIQDYELEIIPPFIAQDVKDKLRKQYKSLNKQLTQEYNKRRETTLDYYRAKNQKMDQHKVIENNLVGLYKAVFSSDDSRVQHLINKTLSTDNAENTASEMDKVLNSANQSPYYSFHSPNLQRDVLKLGASGKIGIGEHSNAVTMNSIFQQSDYEHTIFSHLMEVDGEEVMVPYNIILGNLTFTGKMGNIEVNGVRISEMAMEDQNSATDNQKLQIMGRRNEDKNTMAVLKILHSAGFDNDRVLVNGQQLSYASLFINQPILRRYSKLVNSLSSASNDNKGNPKEMAKRQLLKEFYETLPRDIWKLNEEGEPNYGSMDKNAYIFTAEQLDSKELYNQLLDDKASALSQYVVFKNFLDLQAAATTYNEMQRLVNIERNGMGVSYFDTINAMSTLLNVISGAVNITNSDRMIGNYGVARMGTGAEQEMRTRGYIPVITKDSTKRLDSELYDRLEDGETIWIRPENHYSHKLVNAIALGYNTYNSLFPYNHQNIGSAIESIMRNLSVSENSEQGKKQKYKIVSDLKDYIYTNNSTLFEGNIEQSRRDLFFDNKALGKESLATYLLKLSETREFADLFRKPFFRDLQFEINDISYPSIIKFNNSDISKVNTLSIYNNFEKMMNSNKSLPDFNGQTYNYKTLMRDLMKYSLLADQGNGAIGFRQHLPVELFERHGVIKGISNTTNINSNYQSIAYHGIIKSLETTLGSTLSEDGTIVNNNPNLRHRSTIKALVNTANTVLEQTFGVQDAISYDYSNNIMTYSLYDGSIIKSNFVKQYIQHNVGAVANISGAKLEKLFKANSFSIEDIASGAVKDFYFSTNLDFITIKDANNKLHLYEQVADNYFKEIPTLGVFGMKEYNIKSEQNVSQVAKNNPIDNQTKKLPVDKSLVPRLLTNQEDNQVVGSNMELFLEVLSREDYQGDFAPLFRLFRTFVNFSNVKIQVGKPGNYSARYYPTGVITVNPTLLEPDNFDQSVIAKKVAEEMMHHITVNTLGRYIEFTGFNPQTNSITYNVVQDENGNPVNVPAEVLSLIAVYNAALKHIANKYGSDSIIKKIQGSDNYLNSENGMENNLYRVSNIHEFIAGIFMKDEDFAREMANTPYRNSGESIASKFIKLLTQLFHRVIPGFKKETISGEVAASLTQLLQNMTEDKKGKPVSSQFRLIYDTQEKRQAFSKSLRLINMENERQMGRDELLSEEEDMFNSPTNIPTFADEALKCK